MRQNNVLLLVLLFLTASFLITFPVHAKSKTIVVPDDYPTITAAIGNATDSDAIYVRKGIYREHSLVINKTLSLIGEEVNSTIIMNIDRYESFGASQAWAIPPFKAIEIRVNNVKIQNLTIGEDDAFYVPIGVFANGAVITGNILKAGVSGIDVNGNNNLILQNSIMGPGNRYILCNGSYNSFISNEMTGGGGEGFTIFGSFNIAYGNSFTDGSGSIKVYSEGNTIAKNNLTYSGGLLFGGGSSNNIIYANRIKGAGLNLMGFNNTFYANEIFHIEIGGLHGSLDAANNVFYHNNFLGAAPELRISTREPGPLFWEKGEEGNYWNSYQGLDANNDGIGDVPYTVNAAYYDPDLSMEVAIVCGRDNYPLMTPFDIDSVVMQLPEWASLALASEQPVLILVPRNITYSTAAVPLNFTVPESAKWVRYSLDGQYNVSVTGNTTLNGLANGFHNLTLYADDPFGNTLVSETIHFSVALPAPFPTALVTAASIGSVAVVGLGLFAYFRKIKKTRIDSHIS